MIYFVQDSNTKAIKIGYSASSEKRIASLQTSMPYRLDLLGTVEGGRKREKELHEQFEDYRIRGEWFLGDSEVLTAVRQLIRRSGKLITVWEECCKRSKCRFGIQGVKVALLGDAATFTVRYSRWGPDKRLLLLMEDDSNGFELEARAEDCVLVTDWPRICC